MRILNRSLQRIMSLPYTEQISLYSLSPTESIQMAAICLNVPVDAVPPQLMEFVNLKALGHPFCIEEYVRALLRKEFVKVVPREKCEILVADLMGLDLPDSVEGLIAARIEFLNLSQLNLLKLASVIGQTFDQKALEHLIHASYSNKELDELPSELNTLDKLGYIKTKRESELQVPSNTRYSFRNSLLRNGIYALMLEGQRELVHKTLALYYEERTDETCRGWVHQWTRKKI
jgi:predicted ATPase